MRSVQGKAKVVGELLELVVQLGQDQVAGLQQALQGTAAQPARDRLVGIGRGLVLQLGREARAQTARDQLDPRARIDRLAGRRVDLVLAKDRDALEGGVVRHRRRRPVCHHAG